MNIQIADASRAWAWFQQGYGLFRRDPLVWIVQFVAFMAVLIVLSMVPFIGQFVGTVVSPVFAAGLLWTCSQAESQQPIRIEYLFEGFRRETNPLLTVGLIYGVGSVVVGLVALLALGGGIGLGALVDRIDLTGGLALGVSLMSMLLAALVAFLLMLPLAMAVWFAPPLVLFDRIAPVDAMKLSLMACLKNWRVLLVYGVILLVLGIVASIPFGLGWLVLGPVLVGSTYAAYRDLFRP